MKKEKLQEILSKHLKWVKNEVDSLRAQRQSANANRGREIETAATQPLEPQVQEAGILGSIGNAFSSGWDYVKERLGFGDGVQTENFQITPENMTELAIMLNQNTRGDWSQRKIANIFKETMSWSEADSDKAAQLSCVAASLYIALKASDANVGEFGDFFKDMVNAGHINASNVYVNSRDAISSHYGMEGVTVTDFNQFQKLMNEGGVNSGMVAFRNNDTKRQHNVVVYNHNGSQRVANVGRRSHNGSRYGAVAEYYSLKRNGSREFHYFYYFK